MNLFIAMTLAGSWHGAAGTGRVGIGMVRVFDHRWAQSVVPRVALHGASTAAVHAASIAQANNDPVKI